MFIDLKSDEKQSRITSVKIIIFSNCNFNSKGLGTYRFWFWGIDPPTYYLSKIIYFSFFLQCERKEKIPFLASVNLTKPFLLLFEMGNSL